jgi:hypothetical protein
MVLAEEAAIGQKESERTETAVHVSIIVGQGGRASMEWNVRLPGFAFQSELEIGGACSSLPEIWTS